MIPPCLRAAVLVLTASCAAPTGVPSGAIVHTVYFKLHDARDAQSLVAACCGG